MQELERKAYIFSVETIGLAMSMDKAGKQKEVAARMKQASGKVYTLLTDALAAEENKDFADLFRASYQQAQDARDHLKALNLAEQTLTEQREKLLTMAHEIIERMEEILGKIIY